MGSCMSKDSSASTTTAQPRRLSRPARKSSAAKPLPQIPMPKLVVPSIRDVRSTSGASTATDSHEIKVGAIDLTTTEISTVSEPPSPMAKVEQVVFPAEQEEICPPSPPLASPTEAETPPMSPTDAASALTSPAQSSDLSPPASPPMKPHARSPMMTLSRSLQSSKSMFFPLYGVISKPKKSYVPMLEAKTHNQILPVNVDAVQFGAFGPPSIEGATNFGLSIWAFLVNYDGFSTSELSSVWMAIELGQMVHVTLTAPEGHYTVEDGETKSFVWDHHVTHVHFDIAVIDANMSLPFYATITAGLHVLRVEFQLATLSDGAALTQEYPSQTIVVNEVLHKISCDDLDVHLSSGSNQGNYDDNIISVDRLVENTRPEQLGARMQQMSHHPRVAKVFGVTKIQKQWYWVSEFHEFFSLHTYLAQQLTNDEKMVLLHDIAAGLAHMHHCGLAHNSLSTRHCFVDLDGHASLAGFNAVTAISNEAVAFDVFEFGMLMWETFTDVRASDIGSSWNEIASAIHLGDHAVDIPTPLQSLLLACLNEDPLKRPNMVDLVDALGGNKQKSFVDLCHQLKYQ
ncbi:kinase [Thraustotheca clavata]|uniref:Kinase n=1 Tax=Thraustotheca clavata TaxID=74557 RepID=A0A1V9ZS20_9STRA|nr:kinase [Thraustotheca clavata]